MVLEVTKLEAVDTTPPQPYCITRELTLVRIKIRTTISVSVTARMTSRKLLRHPRGVDASESTRSRGQDVIGFAAYCHLGKTTVTLPFSMNT